MNEQQLDNVPMKSKLSFGFLYFAHSILSGLGSGPITYYYNVELGLSEFLVGLILKFLVFFTFLFYYIF
jgi:Na+/melibiose symporter-like transporter